MDLWKKALFILIVLQVTVVKADTIKDAVHDFNLLQKEISLIFDQSKNYCQLNSLINADKSNCEVQSFCKKFEEQLNSPILFKSNDNIILNEAFVRENKLLQQCYKEKYKDDIEAKVEEFKAKRKNDYLKKVFDLNQKLKKVLATNNENNKFAKINQEILDFRLTEQMNASESLPLSELIKIVEKKLKVKLSPEALKLTLELDSLTSSPKYESESKLFERSLFKEFDLPNIFYDFENFTNPDVVGGEKQLLKNQDLYNQKAQKVHTQFLEAKKAMIEYLEKKKNSKNQEMIKRAIDRVSLIKFRIPVLSESLVKTCEFPNAFYAAKNNTITVCPQWFNLPPMNLFEILSHEVAHSIDACNLQAPLKIKRTKADEVELGAFELNLNLESLNQSEVNPTKIENSDLDFNDQKCTTLESHPFSKSITCLQSADSISAKSPDLKKLKENINNEIKRLRSLGGDLSKNESYKYLIDASSNFEKYQSMYGLCDTNLSKGLSQVQESFADKLSAELIVQKVSKMNKAEAKEELDKIVISFMNDDMDRICPVGKMRTKMQETGKKLGCTYFYDQKTMSEKTEIGLIMGDKIGNDSHPETSDRIEKILFAHPEIRKIMGCSKSGAKYCED
jgi:hypothetical protein